MRPVLVVGLVASLVLSGLAAWWPAPDDTTGLLPVARTAGRVAAAPGHWPAAAVDPGRAAVRPVAPEAALSAAPPVMPATSPTTSASASVLPATPNAATAPAPPAAALPTRAADWPAPDAAALAAWQGAPANPPAASALANPAAPATPPLPVFPYQWIGQLDDGGAPQALLASAQRSVGVRQGAVVDGRWRLDRAPGEPWKATHLPTGLVVSVRGAPSAAEP